LKKREVWGEWAKKLKKVEPLPKMDLLKKNVAWGEEA